MCVLYKSTSLLCIIYADGILNLIVFLLQCLHHLSIEILNSYQV